MDCQDNSLTVQQVREVFRLSAHPPQFLLSHVSAVPSSMFPKPLIVRFFRDSPFSFATCSPPRSVLSANSASSNSVVALYFAISGGRASARHPRVALPEHAHLQLFEEPLISPTKFLTAKTNHLYYSEHHPPSRHSQMHCCLQLTQVQDSILPLCSPMLNTSGCFSEYVLWL